MHRAISYITPQDQREGRTEAIQPENGRPNGRRRDSEERRPFRIRPSRFRRWPLEKEVTAMDFFSLGVGKERDKGRGAFLLSRPPGPLRASVMEK